MSGGTVIRPGTIRSRPAGTLRCSSNTADEQSGSSMYLGWGIFAFAAVACIAIGYIAIKRNRDYGNSEIQDDFDFDEYEGFDKK